MGSSSSRNKKYQVAKKDVAISHPISPEILSLLINEYLNQPPEGRESVALEILARVGIDGWQMSLLSQVIISKAVSTPTNWNYAKLTKSLSELSRPSTHDVSMAFEDILLAHIKQKLLYLQESKEEFDSKLSFVNFLANLFIVDFVPPTMTKRWSESVKDYLLNFEFLCCIQGKVLEELRKPERDEVINELKQLLIDKCIFYPAEPFPQNSNSITLDEDLSRLIGKIRYYSDEVVAEEIKSFVASEEVTIRRLADMVLFEATEATDEEMLKLSSLAKRLSDLSCCDLQMGFKTTFKDVLTSFVLDLLRSHNSNSTYYGAIQDFLIALFVMNFFCDNSRHLDEPFRDHITIRQMLDYLDIKQNLTSEERFQVDEHLEATDYEETCGELSEQFQSYLAIRNNYNETRFGNDQYFRPSQLEPESTNVLVNEFENYSYYGREENASLFICMYQVYVHRVFRKLKGN